MDLDLQRIALESQKIVQGAADFIREEYHKFSSDSIEVKSQNSLVSYVDKTSEKILVQGLQSILPEAGFVTEEDTIHQASSKSLRWIIDPLDGTTNFMHNIPYFSISVALYNNEEALFGLVYDVMHKEMFVAIQNNGATMNGNLISVSHQSSFKDVIIGTGYPYHVDKFRKAHLDSLAFVINNTRGIRRLGSAALDLSYVACGRFGGFYELALNDYDIAAGALLVKEAGGIVTDFHNSKEWLVKGEIAAYSPSILKEMNQILQFFN